jgi:hypothetical protein
MRRIQGPYCCVGPILLCCIVMEISTGWGRFRGGGGGFDPSLAVRGVAPTTVLIALKVECPPVTQGTRVRSLAEANLMHGIQCLFDPWIQDPE